MASFPVSLDIPSSRDVTVDYTATPASASPNDFVPVSGTLRIPAGDTEASVDVPVLGDDLDEEDGETFDLTLSSPANATIDNGSAVGVIVDDDDEPGLVIGGTTANEPGRGSRYFVFIAQLLAPSGRTVTVDFETVSGTAKSPSDYAHTAGTLTFAPGDVSEEILVLVRADNVNEDRERFYVVLSDATNAAIEIDTGIGKIVDAP
jgi:hypothetical protein